MADFGELRSLLHRPPTRQNWVALCDEIERWDSGSSELLTVVLPYAEKLLENYPDTLRVMPASWRNTLLARGQLDLPWYRWARIMNITGERLRIRETRHLVQCRALNALTRLEVFAQISQTTFGLLVQAPYLTSIKELGLRQTNIEDAQFSKLISAPMFERGLRALDLGWSGVSERGLQALAVSPNMKGLETLGLEGCRNLRPQGSWRKLVQGSHLTSVKELDVSKIWLGQNHLDELYDGGMIEQLTRLDISYNELGDAWLTKLFGQRDVSSMRWLNLWNTSLEGDFYEVIAREDPLPDIEHLDLGNNRLKSAHARALLEAGSFRQLRSMSFRSNSLGDDPEELSALPALPNIEELNLWSNHLGNNGAIALANSPILSTLRSINLRHNYLGVRGVEALLSSPYLGELEELDLSVNRLDAAAIDLLSQTDALPKLGKLRLLQNKLGPHDVMRLRDNPHWSSNLVIEL